MTVKPNAQTAHVLKVVAALLKAGREQEAARVLIRDLRRTTASREADPGKWLVRAIGAKPAIKLLHALAHYPCFYCKTGLDECTLCGMQHPNTARRGCCEHCLDLLFVRCDFCDGSGWITYNVIPRDLWPAVIFARTQAALKELAALLKTPLPEAAFTRPTSVRKHLERQLLMLNRLAGILENAVDAVKKYRPSNGITFKPLAVGVVVKSRAAWDRIHRRMRKLLLLLAEALRGEAADAETSQARAIMMDRAEFYVMLSKSRAFAGTSLCHPFLPTWK